MNKSGTTVAEQIGGFFGRVIGWIIGIAIAFVIYSIIHGGFFASNTAGDPGSIIHGGVLENNVGGYSMTYSSKWFKIPNPPANVLDAIAMDEGTALINIKQLPVEEQGITQEGLNSYYSDPSSIIEMENEPNVESVSVLNYVIAGVPVKVVHYIETVNVQGQNLQLFTNTYYVLNPTKTALVMINYLAYNEKDFNKYYSEATTIINSFKFN